MFRFPVPRLFFEFLFDGLVNGVAATNRDHSIRVFFT
jgi:hypothetical protein